MFKANCARQIQTRRIRYSCLFKKYEFFIGTRCQIFPCNVFGNGGIKPIRITERGSSGVREGLSQSRLRYSRAVRTPRRADLFENPRKWHVSPVVRHLATLYAPRRCLSPSHHPPTPSHYIARSLLFPRASNASSDFLTLPMRFRYSRSKLSVACRSQFSVLSRAPIWFQCGSVTCLKSKTRTLFLHVVSTFLVLPPPSRRVFSFLSPTFLHFPPPIFLPFYPLSYRRFCFPRSRWERCIHARVPPTHVRVSL